MGPTHRDAVRTALQTYSETAVNYLAAAATYPSSLAIESEVREMRAVMFHGSHEPWSARRLAARRELVKFQARSKRKFRSWQNPAYQGPTTSDEFALFM